MMVRATDNDGNPLTHTEVDFQIIDGAGQLSPVGPLAFDTPQPSRVMATTDAEGYA